MDDFEIELKNDFLQEASELLQNTEQSFLELEKDPENKTLIDTIFRFAHNLKGTSQAVGFSEVAGLTHNAENLLLEIKNGTISATPFIVSILLEFNDKVREMIEGLRENLEASFNCALLMESLADVIAGKGAGEINQESSLEVITDVSVKSACVETVEAGLVEEASLSGLKDNKTSKKETRKEEETLRVSLVRLETLNDLVGELVILQTRIECSLIKLGEHKTSRSLGKLCKNIQDLSMSLRMVPVGPTFQKLTRVVRDTSKLLNKKVELRLIGEETEIDKTVVEGLGDPLVHIIRNAIDHGIETPEERAASGKSEQGIIEIMAFHEGNFLVIQITDDGKGINPLRLIERAKLKGIIPAHAELTAQEGIELIFHPGFSSKDEVSEVSGRGVGMDVVKTNIEVLGGEVKVRSRVGTGSCFRLMLPLTLAIIDGMLIQAGEHLIVIPRNQVQEVIRLSENQVTNITGRGSYLTLRKEVLPIFHLGNDLELDNGTSRIAIIVNQGDVAFAVGISDVLRQQQVVVKPPTKEILGKPGVMGTTILADGKPSLILDLINLYSKRVRKTLAVERSTAA